MAPYTEWEDWQRGMWRDVPATQAECLIAEAAALLSSPHKLRAAMRDVTTRWPVACEVNLTHDPHNRAWLGQAACCYAADVPEELTRKAWGLLTDRQRADANAVADAVISEWRYRRKRRAQLEFAYA